MMGCRQATACLRERGPRIEPTRTSNEQEQDVWTADYLDGLDCSVYHILQALHLVSRPIQVWTPEKHDLLAP